MAIKRKRKPKGGRLHIRVSKELEDRVHDYVARHSTNLTVLVTKFFTELLEAEDANKKFPEVEQI